MSIHYKPTQGRAMVTSASGKVSINETVKRLQYEVGAYIREQREKLGITQRDLAKIVGVTNNHISDIENGHRKLSPERYIEMAKALQVEREEFGKMLLLHYDPYTYRMIFGGRRVDRILAEVPDRIGGYEDE
jgi:transcriptional regulator with XRE-family HTH domain